MNIGIFYARYPQDGPNGAGYLYQKTPQFRYYLQELMAEIEALGARPVVLCTEETYAGDNTFARYWLPSKKDVGYFEPVEERIRIDGLFDKGYFRAKAGLSLVNVPELAELGRDKSAQYVLFGDLQPKTITVETQDDFVAALAEIPGELVVVKPNNLNGGRGVQIMPKDDVLDYVPDGPTIVQQFIDGSQGVRGVGSGLHDLRLYIIDGEPAFASIRTPKEGSLISNTSQGGSIAFFDIAKIPEEPKALARDVDQHMQQFGNRYYSVDMICGPDRWYIIEINDRPGVPARFQSPSAQAFQRRLAACLTKATKNPANHTLLQ